MLLNCIIVDDELPAQKVLAGLISDYCPTLTISGIASSAEEARQLLKTYPVDLLFLDINMPTESGFDLLNSISTQNITVVFVTGNQEYALRALKASAADFLLKPVDIDELKQAVQKVTVLHDLRNQNNQLNTDYISSVNMLAENLKNQQQITRITLHHLQGFKIISIAEIIYLEAEGNYTIFHMKGGEKIVVSRGMGEYEQLLNADTFVRTHKSFIINLNFLKEYSTADGYFAIMQDGANVIISRRRVEFFLDRIKHFSVR